MESAWQNVKTVSWAHEPCDSKPRNRTQNGVLHEIEERPMSCQRRGLLQAKCSSPRPVGRKDHDAPGLEDRNVLCWESYNTIQLFLLVDFCLVRAAGAGAGANGNAMSSSSSTAIVTAATSDISSSCFVSFFFC
jgi:hypothetical protein